MDAWMWVVLALVIALIIIWFVLSGPGMKRVTSKSDHHAEVNDDVPVDEAPVAPVAPSAYDTAVERQLGTSPEARRVLGEEDPQAGSVARRAEHGVVHEVAEQAPARGIPAEGLAAAGAAAGVAGASAWGQVQQDPVVDEAKREEDAVVTPRRLEPMSDSDSFQADQDAFTAPQGGAEKPEPAFRADAIDSAAGKLAGASVVAAGVATARHAAADDALHRDHEDVAADEPALADERVADAPVAERASDAAVVEDVEDAEPADSTAVGMPQVIDATDVEPEAVASGSATSGSVADDRVDAGAVRAFHADEIDAAAGRLAGAGAAVAGAAVAGAGAISGLAHANDRAAEADREPELEGVDERQAAEDYQPVDDRLTATDHAVVDSVVEHEAQGETVAAEETLGEDVAKDSLLDEGDVVIRDEEAVDSTAVGMPQVLDATAVTPEAVASGSVADERVDAGSGRAFHADAIDAAAGKLAGAGAAVAGAGVAAGLAAHEADRDVEADREPVLEDVDERQAVEDYQPVEDHPTSAHDSDSVTDERVIVDERTGDGLAADVVEDAEPADSTAVGMPQVIDATAVEPEDIDAAVTPQSPHRFGAEAIAAAAAGLAGAGLAHTASHTEVEEPEQTQHDSAWASDWAEEPPAALGDLEHTSSVDERDRLGDVAHGAGEGSASDAEPVPYVTADYAPDALANDLREGDRLDQAERDAELVAPLDFTADHADAQPSADSGETSIAAPTVIDATGIAADDVAADDVAADDVASLRSPDYGASEEAASEPDIEQVWDGPFGPGSAEAAPDGSGPRGWTVKAARQTKVYLTPDIAVYGAAKANVWFVDEQRAIDAGFRRWDMPK